MQDVVRTKAFLGRMTVNQFMKLLFDFLLGQARLKQQISIGKQLVKLSLHDQRMLRSDVKAWNPVACGKDGLLKGVKKLQTAKQRHWIWPHFVSGRQFIQMLSLRRVWSRAEERGQKVGVRVDHASPAIILLNVSHPSAVMPKLPSFRIRACSSLSLAWNARRYSTSERPGFSSGSSRTMNLSPLLERTCTPPILRAAFSTACGSRLRSRTVKVRPAGLEAAVRRVTVFFRGGSVFMSDIMTDVASFNKPQYCS